MKEIDEKEAQKKLENGYDKAEKLLNNEDKLEKFLQKLEKKMKTIPVLGGVLSDIPVLISLVKSYIKKEYTDIPVHLIVAVISGLIYFLSPVDAIPDFIPGFGYVDDVSVIALCLKLVDDDLKEYQKWREDNNKII